MIIVLPSEGSELNSRGDVFTDRMTDVVRALGYDVTNIHVVKSGREIDISAKHRRERREARFECKAEKGKSTGPAVNKFLGVVERERSQQATEVPISGYFVSVSGFTSAAIAQEEEGRFGPRIILLSEPEIRDELIGAAVVPKPAVALAAADGFRQVDAELGSTLVGQDLDLIASELGWLWLVHFEEAGTRVAQTVVLPSGVLLGAEGRARVQEGLQRLGHSVRLVGPRGRSFDDVRTEYRRILATEYAYLSYEGLPADSSMPTALGLAEIYAPLRVERSEDADAVERGPARVVDVDLEFYDDDDDDDGPGQTIGSCLGSARLVTILGGPGSGKSTVLRRLALALLAGEQTFLAAAEFKQDSALPLLINCRDIEPTSTTPIDLIKDIPRKGARPDLAKPFFDMAIHGLQEGSAIVMVDGLDEIPTELARSKFVRNLLQLSSAYPAARIVVTSREPGYRRVAGALERAFLPYRLLDLRPKEIRELVARWFELVPRPHGRGTTADGLSRQIIETDRLSRLAVNPLLLMTLLIVERWAGNLPRRRVELYERAIEVLLMTWNIEAHEPLNLEEVLPQLGYLAREMTETGEQRIPQTRLIEVLAEARAQMPELLGYTDLSARDFLAAIETRSSLLVQVGFTEYGARLEPAYEFKHLTFQEFLTARAVKEGWSSVDSDVSDDLAGALADHFLDSAWVEIVPLVASLSGRKAKAIVAALCDAAVDALNEPPRASLGEFELDDDPARAPFEMLARCLADEVQVDPETGSRSLQVLTSSDRLQDWDYGLILDVRGTRYWAQLEKLIVDYCRRPDAYETQYMELASGALMLSSSEDSLLSPDLLLQAAESEDTFERIGAFTSIAFLFFYQRGSGVFYYERRYDISPALLLGAFGRTAMDLAVERYCSSAPASELDTAAPGWAICWMLARGGSAERMSKSDTQQVVLKCVELMGQTEHAAHHYAAWIITVILPTVTRGSLPFDISFDADRIPLEEYAGRSPSHGPRASWLLHYHAGRTTDDELRRALPLLLESHLVGRSFDDAAAPFLGLLAVPRAEGSAR